MGGAGGTSQLRIMLSQPSLAGVGAGAELGKTRLGQRDWKAQKKTEKKAEQKNYKEKLREIEEPTLELMRYFTDFLKENS